MFNSDSAEVQANKAAKRIMREIAREGEAACTLFGDEYEFVYDGISSAEIHKNGEYFTYFGSMWELEEILIDIFDR